MPFSPPRRPSGPAALLVALVATAVLAPASPAAPVRPAIGAPVSVEAGSTLVFTASSVRDLQRCTLQVASPTGQRAQAGLAQLLPTGTGVRAKVSRTARAGLWTLVLRCGATSSLPTTVTVTGTGSAKGGSLLTRLSVFRFSRKYPKGLARPARNQEAAGAPTFEAEAIDGLGAATGDRPATALQWALKQVGRKDYRLWCLRFVANAYNSTNAGYPTAQAAADALDLRDRGGSPSSAPAGSLVFFHFVATDGRAYGHVGISLGDGRMVSAQDTVKIERIADVPAWRQNYLGWAYAPTVWPGFPPRVPDARLTPPPAEVAPAPFTPIASVNPVPGATPPPGDAEPQAPVLRRRLIVDNRLANGPRMVEDTYPTQLQTRPWVFCNRRKCMITDKGTERFSGGVYEWATCQTQGDRMTNGNDSDASDDANPELYESRLYYGITQDDGLFGYVSEVLVRAEDRGGLGLPECPPYPAS